MNPKYNGDDDIPILKIVVVGQSGVGKSNMISRFVYSKFFLGASPTVGSQVDLKKITINKNQQVNLYIWDTAGQQRYRSLNKSFYRGALGALVIFDLGAKQTFDCVGKWIEQIRQCTSQKIVLLLIGNKCDIKNQQVTVQQATEFARKEGMGYLQTSAALDINVHAAFETLASKIYRICQKSSTINSLPVIDKNDILAKKNSKKSQSHSIVLNKKNTMVTKKREGFKNVCCK